MPDNKTQLVLCHKIEQSRVNIHNMRLALTFGSKRKRIHRRISGNIKIDFFSEFQLIFHLLAKIIKIRQEFRLHLQTVSLHTAPPVGVVIGNLGLP